MERETESAIKKMAKEVDGFSGKYPRWAAELAREIEAGKEDLERRITALKRAIEKIEEETEEERRLVLAERVCNREMRREWQKKHRK